MILPMPHDAYPPRIHHIAEGLLNELVKFLVYIAAHPVVLCPGLLGGIQVEPSRDTKIPRFIITRDLDTPWGGVRANNNDAMFSCISVINRLGKLILQKTLVSTRDSK